MTTSAVRTSTEEYLAGLRAALEDLPAPEVAEILDDAGAHLAELRAELGDEVDLTERLGTPQAYAAELRAAAGYPPAPVPSGLSAGAAQFALAALVGSTALVLLGPVLFGALGPGLVVLALVLPFLALPVVVHAGPRVAAVAALPSVRRFVASAPEPDSAAGRAVGFFASLQPAWWLLRAAVAAFLVVGFALGTVELVWVAVWALVFAPVSVWLGFRSRRDRRLLWAVVPLNALAAVVLVTGPFALGYGTLPTPAYSAPAPYYEGLWQDGEYPIEDIVPRDVQGAPLSGVYLYDQDGRPIDAVPSCYDSYGLPHPPLSGPYPRGTVEYDERTDACVRTSASDVGVPPAVPRDPYSSYAPLPDPSAAPPADQAPPTG